MNKIDWSTAPEGAELYAERSFCKLVGIRVIFYNEDYGWTKSPLTPEQCLGAKDYQPCPQQWPTEDRIDAIGTNGNTGEHYTKSAADYLSQGMQILTERGKQYGSNSRECSFPQVAEAFNAITGNELSGSDVCMILAILKLVRQSAQPDRLHEDSLVDGVNIMALYAEMVGKELAR